MCMSAKQQTEITVSTHTTLSVRPAVVHYIMERSGPLAVRKVDPLGTNGLTY